MSGRTLGRSRRAPKRLDVVGVGAWSASKDRGAGDERRRSGSGGLARAVRVDAAVNLQLHAEILLGDTVGDGFDLLELSGDELLPAEPGIDGPHQDDVD